MEFIVDTFHDIEIPDRLLSVIMKCLTSTTMQISWNGDVYDVFKPSRGFRQGDPLSPYIFVLCMERLSQLIIQEVKMGHWQAIKLGKNGPPISYLFFADDLVLFSKANNDQVLVVEKVFNYFCDCSGQRLSKDKSMVFFSRNVNDKTAKILGRLLGMKVTNNLGRYLGVPLIYGRITKETYKYIIERVDKRLKDCSSRRLSMAGRLMLNQTVLSVILSFTMQTAALAKTTCSAIDKVRRDFL